MKTLRKISSTLFISLFFASFVAIFPAQSYASNIDPVVAKSTLEQLAEAKATGKRNTEILIIVVTAGLLGLVGVGYALQNLKKSSSTNVKVKKVSKKTLASLSVITFGAIKTFTPAAAYAVCPVCVVGVGAALGLAEVLHIDDTITGAWIGGMGVAVFFWMVDFMGKRNWTFKFKFGNLLRNVILAGVTAYFIYLAVAGYITNHTDHLIVGVDKMIVGPLFGAILFTAATQLHFFLREKNGGKAYFPFQKVVIPMSSLLVSTIIFYFMIYAR